APLGHGPRKIVALARGEMTEHVDVANVPGAHAGPRPGHGRYVNVPAMPSQPRVVPIPCPRAQTGAIVYAYYVEATEPALIDTGVASSPETIIEPALNASGASLKDVRWILATHGHWDHIGGAHAAHSRAAEGVTVAMHADDTALLRSRRAHLAPD